LPFVTDGEEEEEEEEEEEDGWDALMF